MWVHSYTRTHTHTQNWSALFAALMFLKSPEHWISEHWAIVRGGEMCMHVYEPSNGSVLGWL